MTPASPFIRRIGLEAAPTPRMSAKGAPRILGGLAGNSQQLHSRNAALPIGISSGDVWHYTGGAGLRGILGSHSLWASSFDKMNDPGEIEYGLAVLAQAWASMSETQPPAVVEYINRLINPDSLSQVFDQVFLLSVCRDGDNLTQWRSYAGADGVSLGLDAAAPLHSDPRGFAISAPNIWGVSWIKVIYRKSVQVARSKLFLQEIAESLGNPELRDHPQRLEAQQLQTILHVASFKYPAYEDERELRSAVMVSGATTPTRHTDGGMVPYVPFVRLGPGSEILPLPLTSVRCGPTATAADFSTYRQIMNDAGYGEVPLIRSTIPFR
jgi:hypothetical protein